MSQLHDYVHQLLRELITEQRDRSEPREIYYEVMSARGWMNPQFSNLVDEVAIFSQLIEEDSPRNARLEDVVLMAAEEWLHMDLGEFILSDRSLSNRLTDKQYRDAEDAAIQKERAIREIERALNSSRRDRGGRSDRYDDRDRDRRDDRRGRDRDRDRGGRGNDRWNDRGRSSRRDRPGEGSMMSGGISAARKRDAENRREEEIIEERSRRREHVPESRREPEARAEKTKGFSRQELARYTVNGPDFSKSRPYDDFLQNGEIWQAAHLSQFKLDPKQHPFLTAYDFNKKIRFLVKDADGNIREEFIDMNDDLDYLRHELAGTDPREARRQAAEKKRPQVKQTDTDQTPQRQERQVNRIRLNLNTSKMEKTTLITSSTTEAEAIVALERVMKGEDLAARHVMVLTPLLSDDQTIAALEDVSNARSLSEASELLLSYKEQMNPIVYKTVNEKMAFRLTHALRNSFGQKVRLSDFASDYGKAYQWMRETHGENWARSFGNRMRSLISDVFSSVTQKDAAGVSYLSGLFDMPEEKVGEQVKANLLQDHYTVISVNVKLKDLSLTLTKDPQMVCDREMPELHRLIEEAFAAHVETGGGMGRVYLITQDGERIEFFQNGLDLDAYLISQMV